MEPQTTEAARSCSRCIYWHPDAIQAGLGQCRYGPPVSAETPNGWPQSRSDAWCFRWKGGEGSVRVSAMTTELILNYLEACGQVPVPGTTGANMQHVYQGWAQRSFVIADINREKGFSKQAVMSRIQTLVKYGILGMGKYPPGVSSEQPQMCVWKLGGAAVAQEITENEDEPVNMNPGRPRIHTPDIIVNYLRKNHCSPSNRIGTRPLHRAINLSIPMSMGTCRKLIEEAMALGQIQRHDTGYWASAQKTDNTDMEVEA